MTDPDTAPKAGKEQRFDAYLDRLKRLKEEGTTLREILEREMLLTFIRANRENINEFPMLETQQHAVINLMCQRSEHPAYEHIHRLTGNFLVLLPRFEKARIAKDEELLEQTRTHLANTETQLIKCMQGIVYACGLVTDNFEEQIVMLFGPQGLSDFNDLLKEHGLGRPFWKAFVDRFVVGTVDKGHESILTDETFAMNKEGKLLVIRFFMDQITSGLANLNQKVDKTRIQKGFELVEADQVDHRTLKLVNTILKKGLSFIPAELLPAGDLLAISRIVCIDGVAKEFLASYEERTVAAKREPEESRAHELKFKFLMEQVIATGVGAVIGAGETRDELLAVLPGTVFDSIRPAHLRIQDFAVVNLRRVLMGFLEDRLAFVLRGEAAEQGGKVQVIKNRTRRAPGPVVDLLFDKGLTKIRKNKIWRRDPHDEKSLLFRVRTERELAAMSHLLQIEPELFADIDELWKAEDFKVEIMLVIDLEQVARTTTNLKARLGEMLTAFRLVGHRPTPKEPEPASPEITRAAPEPAETKPEAPSAEPEPAKPEPPAE